MGWYAFVSLAIDGRIKFLLIFIFVAVLIASLLTFVEFRLKKKKANREEKSKEDSLIGYLDKFSKSEKTPREKLDALNHSAKVYFRDNFGFHLNTSYSELIKEFEGCRQVAYQDSVGVWTIGYGHTKTAYEGRLAIKKTCERLLAEDLVEFEEYVDTLVKVPLTQNQFDALVSWTFNLGPGNLQESTLLKKLNQGLYAEVPTEMRRWNKAGGEVLDGLVRRREAEVSLFLA